MCSHSNPRFGLQPFLADSISSDNCNENFGTEKTLKWVYEFWALKRFFNPQTYVLSKIFDFQAFSSFSNLIQFVQTMSNDIGVNLYLSWFYLRGAEMPLIYDDKFYNILSQKFGASVNDYDYESFGDDDDDGNSCSGFNQCESVFDNLNESMISKLEKVNVCLFKVNLPMFVFP